MNIYIWEDEDTLVDYGIGLIVAVASSLKEANKIVKLQILEKYGYDLDDEEYNYSTPTQIISLNQIYIEPEAWACRGSA